MPTREELRGLAVTRLREAEALFAVQLYDGCVYLCGYVVELALKARICAVLNLTEYPGPDTMKRAFLTHDFDDLRLLAGLRNEIALTTGLLLRNWSLATQWTPESRYLAVGTNDRVRAEQVLEAVRGTPMGIFTWLRQRW